MRCAATTEGGGAFQIAGSTCMHVYRQGMFPVSQTKQPHPVVEVGEKGVVDD